VSRTRAASRRTAPCWERRARGIEILRLAAEEEAAKVRVLLDAVRCPRAKRPDDSARQLQYFNDHLAKGIYAECCDRRPAGFGDVRRWIERERKDLYLDGPSGVDWIFYNESLRRREERIYIDFVENDGEHVWHDPMMLEQLGIPMSGRFAPSVVRLVTALGDAGCFDAPALKVVADVWRPVAIDDEFPWHSLREVNRKTLQLMEESCLLNPGSDETYARVVDEWPFPMYGLDLRRKRVDKNELREIRDNWVVEP
jgi:hypothetical protein